MSSVGRDTSSEQTAKSQNKIFLIYHDNYNVDLSAFGLRHQFDMLKPKRIHDELLRQGTVEPDDFIAPSPLTGDELRLVHTDEYLAKLEDRQALAEILGLPQEYGPIPESLDLLNVFLLMSGGTLLGTKLAYSRGAPVFNLGGGYHHAQTASGGGYCAINDVAIAIREARRTTDIQKCLIIDLDYHQGNGNIEIFSRDEDVFTFSIHAHNWMTLGGKQNHRDVETNFKIKEQDYLQLVEEHLADIVPRFQPDFVFYLAGSDPHYADPLGNLGISDSGMLKRDLIVMEHTYEQGLPVLCLLAGGYGLKSWLIHHQFIREAARRYGCCGRLPRSRSSIWQQLWQMLWGH